MLKKLLLTVLLSSYIFAYNVGDSIDSALVEKLSLQNDKVYVLNFFASWCRSCKKELPIMNTLDKKNIIGINIDKDSSTGKKFVKTLGLKFRVIYDSDNSIVKQFSPVGVPALYFVKNGKIVAQKFGAVHKVDEYVLSTLKETK